MKNSKKITCLALAALSFNAIAQKTEKPNVLLIMTDQWRAQAFGYAGDPNVKTPNIDQLAGESINFKNAVSVCPACSPARASLLTGQYPLSTGVYVNDARLSPDAVTIGETFKDAGYATAYIGKWHVDGHGRHDPIPKERRHGFDYWKALECSHAYNNSIYFDENNEKHTWPGYDAFPQTDSAISFMSRQKENPFLMVLSYGPPHSPYMTAPEKYQKMYQPENLILPPNIPDWRHIDTRPNLCGYYAHCTAVDDCIGRVMRKLDSLDLTKNTIVLFLSDHGEMIGTKGFYDKQVPFDESIRVPFLLKIPGKQAKEKDFPVNMPDIFPTLAALCNITIPKSVEGYNLKSYIEGANPPAEGALIQFVHPFGKWNRGVGGREYRAIRTPRYTYVEEMAGAWLLYDNRYDPFQENNLVNDPAAKEIQAHLTSLLHQELEKRNDEFLSSKEYNKKFGYKTGCNGKIVEFEK